MLIGLLPFPPLKKDVIRTYLALYTSFEEGCDREDFSCIAPFPIVWVFLMSLAESPKHSVVYC
jgi:hypothetical protein